MISLDTETTGLDFHHGCKPFLVTVAFDNQEQYFWEWEVNPYTRQPNVLKNDVKEIKEILLGTKERLAFQNSIFDLNMLRVAGILNEKEINSLWSRVDELQIASHLLNSTYEKNLASLALRYLYLDIETDEEKLNIVCKRARDYAKKYHPDWLLAEELSESNPSLKGKVWKADMWLPKYLYDSGEIEDELFSIACSTYANSDSAVTLLLAKELRERIKEQSLIKLYKRRLQLLPVVYTMQNRGITLSSSRLAKLENQYREELQVSKTVCTNIAKRFDYDLTLPKSGNNGSLTSFIFDHLKLPVVKKSKKTGNPSLDKSVIDHYTYALPPKSIQSRFIHHLSRLRKRGTALNYIEGYRRFSLPSFPEDEEWKTLFPSLHPCGTATLRMVSSNPNGQNISKKEGFNLREPYGPLPGRVWYSVDANNIELRLPAYEAGEKEMIELFEEPNKAPYFGSNHLLVFDTLHPEKWDKNDPEGLLKAKKKYASTWYQRVKNGNFAVQYGALEISGTADAAYGVKGGQRIVQNRFKKIKKLNKQQIKLARERGFVETIIDKTVDPDRGYPLHVPKDQYGRISPTRPLNYHVQGSAMWWMCEAMIRCYEYLQEVNKGKPKSKHCYIIMQVHDELVFDLPDDGRQENIMKNIAAIMASCGEGLGIPTPVSVEKHSENWSESEVISFT